MELDEFDAHLFSDLLIVRRTLQAIEAARLAGRTDLNAHFGGSMLAWEAAGEPLVR